MKFLYSLLALCLSTIILSAQSHKSLHLPSELSGDTLRLKMAAGKVLFQGTDSTNTLGFNGPVLGPSLRLQKGQQVRLEVENQLADSTTVHWHGLNVAAHNDGGPHTVIPQQSTWTPEFTVLDHAGTYWYHPHLHHKTQEHVDKGLAGLIIVEDSLEQSLNLPRSYGVDDWPLILQTKNIDSLTNQIVTPSHADHVFMVNATINPELNLPAQVVRLRLLNGSAMRSFRLGLDNNQSFYVIASDGGLLDSTYSVNRLEMAPGERYEILLNLNGLNGQNIKLMSYASELDRGTYGASQPGRSSILTLNNYSGNPLNGSDFEVLKINIGPATSNAVSTIPGSLRPIQRMNPSLAHRSRSFIFSTQWSGPNQLNGPFLINNKRFDMSRIDETVPLNSMEVWEVSNFSPMAHPFHVHKVQFQIIERASSTTIDPIENGFKDVVMVYPMQTVKIIAKFEDFANDTLPYMYHCHMLKHEDDGMMGQFVISSTPIGQKENTLDNEWGIYPNPAVDFIEIQGLEEKHVYDWKIFTLDGRELDKGQIQFQNKIEVKALKAGSYLLQFEDLSTKTQKIDLVQIVD